MIDERMFNLLRDQLALANDEKARAYDQIRHLIEEVHMLRQVVTQGDNDIRSELKEYRQRVEYLTSVVKAKDERIFLPGTGTAEHKNIRSEDAVRKAAFMHSLFESCSLQRISSYAYITELFYKYKHLDQLGKVNILPCYHLKNHKKTNMQHVHCFIKVSGFRRFRKSWRFVGRLQITQRLCEVNMLVAICN